MAGAAAPGASGLFDWDAAVRAEARNRSTRDAEGKWTNRPEFQLDPRIGMRLGSVWLSYSPRILQGDGWPPALLHRGELAAALAPNANWRLGALQRVSYGTTDLSPFSQTDATTPVPTATPLSLLTSETAAGADGALSPRFGTTVRLSWLSSGGADAAAQRLVPRQNGPSASFALRWDASRENVLTTGLAGGSTAMEAGRRASLATLFQALDRPLRADLRMRAELGVASGFLSDPAMPALDVSALPLAATYFSYRAGTEPGSPQATLGLRAAPFLDRYEGAAYERMEVAASAGWSPARRFDLRARGFWGLVVTGAQAGASLSSAEAETAWQGGPAWSLSFGLRAARQDKPVSFVQWGAFVSFSATTPRRESPWGS